MAVSWQPAVPQQATRSIGIEDECIFDLDVVHVFLPLAIFVSSQTAQGDFLVHSGRALRP